MVNKNFLIFLVIIFFSIAGKSQEYINKTLIVKISASVKFSSIDEPIQKIQQAYPNEIHSIHPVFTHQNQKKINKSMPDELGRFIKVEVKSPNSVAELLKELSELKYVEYAEPYPVAKVFDAPDDPQIGSQYYLNTVKAFAAHDLEKGDTNIVIGIVDSGFDMLHEDLKDNYKYNYADPVNNIDDDGDGYVDNYYGWDIADNDMNPQSLVNINGDANYHGTRVAGMASAVTNNGIGIASLGYRTKILPIKAMDGSGYIVAGYEGMVYAADHGCQIINCSWGSNSPSKFAQEVINYVTQVRNCLVVAAAGNASAAIDGKPETLFYPASYNHVLSVAATNINDIRWNGSSYALTVDVSAPGENVFSTKQDNNYGSGSGTSYAAPLVSGLAGLVKAQHPKFTQEQLAEQIRITSDNVDTILGNNHDYQIGFGRVNALRALSINDLPSIRISNFNLSKYDSNGIEDGDSLKVTFTATNYLAQATNTTIRLTTNSIMVEPVFNEITTGRLETFDSVNNNSKPFLFCVKPDIPYDSKVWFKFEMDDKGYHDYQIFEVLLNKTFINISENQIQATLTSNGRIGYADSVNKMGIGFNYQNTGLLYKGGIIIGNSSTHMASSLFDTEEFETQSVIDTLRNNYGELIATTRFSTKPETGLTIDVIQNVKALKSENLESTLIYDYQLINTGTENLNKLKMAKYIDWDLDNYLANKMKYNEDLNLFYTLSNSSEVIYAGVCLLNDMKPTPYGFDLKHGGNGIDIINGFNNDLKWITMTNDRDSAGSGWNTNVSGILTTDFFDLEAGDTMNISYALIAGNNYQDLITKTEAVWDLYHETSIITKNPGQINMYPNPFTRTITLEFTNSDYCNHLDVFTTTGTKVLHLDPDKESILTLNLKSLKQGVYIIQCQTPKGIITQKIIKTP